MGVYLAIKSTQGTSHRFTSTRPSVRLLGVTLHHVPNVRSTSDVVYGDATDARSVLPARLALVGTGVACNLGANGQWD